MSNIDGEDSGAKEAILRILKEKDQPITFGDLLELLEHKEFSVSTIRRALQKLQDENKVAALPEASEGQGRPRFVYLRLREESGKTQVKDEVDSMAEEAYPQPEENILRVLARQAVGGVMDRIPAREKKRIYGETAEKLMGEDPVELFVKYAKWLKSTYSSFYDSFAKPKSSRDKDAARNNMLRLQGTGRRVFNQWFGVPWEKAGLDGTNKVVFRLKHSSEGNVSVLDEKELRKYLKWSILGDRFLETVQLPPQKRPLRIGGSDSSNYWVDIGRVLPWNSASRPLAIITAVGAKYDINKKTLDWDINPDPKVLAQYERRRAIEEGYLITPEMLQDEDSMLGRIKEAAMDLRQYLKDDEVLFQKGVTDIQFRDGRVFPVEHRFSDAVNYGTHGDMVRRCLQAFQNIVARVGTEDGRVLFCGFVKRVNLDVVAPIVLWYIGFGSAEDGQSSPIFPLTPEEYLSSPENYGHNQLINGLFSAISDRIPKNHSIVTFRTIRRFQSMQEPSILNTKPSVDRTYWEEKLREIGERYKEEDYFEDAISAYAFLLAKASIVTFYSSEPSTLNPEVEKDIMIPRIEVLLPYNQMDYGENGNLQIAKMEREYVKRIASVMTDEDVLDVYSDPLMPWDMRSPKVFMIPKPVKEAHEISKGIAKTYSELFLGLLVKEVKSEWLRMQASKL